MPDHTLRKVEVYRTQSRDQAKEVCPQDQQYMLSRNAQHPHESLHMDEDETLENVTSGTSNLLLLLLRVARLLSSRLVSLQ